MASNIQIVEKAALALGARFDSKHQVGYGQVKGFTMLIKPVSNNSKSNLINIFFCAAKDGIGADREIIASKGLPDGVKYYAAGLAHTFDIRVTMKAQDVIGRIVMTAETAADALTEAGYSNCSQNGVQGFTDIYFQNGNFFFLTSEEASALMSELRDKKEEYDSIVENKLLGTIGALVGSLVGVLVILLIGRLGRISILGGLIMGGGCILCYKKLGRKLSTSGAVICTVIAVIMSYVSFRLDTAFDVMNAFKEAGYGNEVDLAFCIANSKEMFILSDSLHTYYINLVMMLLGGAGGAAAVLWGDLITTKSGFELKMIGEAQ